jgi:hypothetical protein
MTFFENKHPHKSKPLAPSPTVLRKSIGLDAEARSGFVGCGSDIATAKHEQLRHRVYPGGV